MSVSSPIGASPMRKLRIANKISARALAAILECDHKQILRMEEGVSKSTVLAEKVCNFFGREFINEIHVLYPERFKS